MADTISFSSGASLDLSTLSTCSLCQSEPAWLQYDVNSDDGISDVMTGVCCAGCAQRLLESLEKLQGAQMTVKNVAERQPAGPNDHTAPSSRTSPSVP